MIRVLWHYLRHWYYRCAVDHLLATDRLHADLPMLCDRMNSSARVINRWHDRIGWCGAEIAWLSWGVVAGSGIAVVLWLGFLIALVIV